MLKTISEPERVSPVREQAFEYGSIRRDKRFSVSSCKEGYNGDWGFIYLFRRMSCNRSEWDWLNGGVDDYGHICQSWESRIK